MRRYEYPAHQLLQVLHLRHSPEPSVQISGAHLQMTTIQPATAAVVLAAGKSTRMKSRIPKALHPVCGLAMVEHVVRAVRGAGCGDVVVVVGHAAETVRDGIREKVEFAHQKQQRGSGDAVLAARDALACFDGDVLVLACDTPLIRPETIRMLLETHRSSGASATMLTAMLEDPTGYGRIVRDADGSVHRIVEHRDASDEEKSICEVNPSIYVFRSQALWRSLQQVAPNNSQGEFYLTDTIGILRAAGERVAAVTVDDSREVMGVNNRAELAQAGELLRARILHRLMLEDGVTIVDPATTYADVDVRVGMDTVLHPNTHLIGEVTIGEQCSIGPGTVIRDSVLGDGCTVQQSVVRGSRIADDVRIGPFAHIRPHSQIGNRVRIGDFVEINRSVIGDGVAAAHLAYVGDAEVGEGTNIAAGVVTCNYDGFKKHKTVIGTKVFVGTHATLIAPVQIGDGAYIAAGSPINQNVPADAMAIARERQVTKPEWAARYRRQREGEDGSAR
jgi:bifunctional UDP-N-acetylglucosamine pyrophosphorylase/glucosamine-1-phosphate N-acetyltransferase